MNEERFQAALAGLVHDIGKVEQRAQEEPWKVAPGIETEGQPVHATWSSYFGQHYIADKYKGAAFAGAYHHAPEKSPAADKSLSQIVALADKLSAGERADLPEKGQSPPQQMISIFDRIDLGQGTGGSTNEWHYLPLKALALDEAAIFPGKVLSPEARRQSYEMLRDQLRQAAKQDIENPQVYLENLLATFQRFTWCIPSAYYHSVPDVSLYDHSRMTAALAVCVQEIKAERREKLLAAVRADFGGKATSAQAAELDEPVALLVGGDLSGVQDFIYTISSKGAAKTLRGRSFYLQLLTEAILRYVLSHLELPYTNVIYSGGGHFFLLAPLSAAQTLPSIQRQITQKLLKYHGNELYLALAWNEVPARGFRAAEFSNHWGEMHGSLRQAKLRRYLELGDSFYEQIFQPPDQGGNPEATCSVCGSEFRPVTAWDEEREEQAQICSLCRSFTEELGRLLPETRFLALGHCQPEEATNVTAAQILKAFGLEVQFLRSAEEKVHLPGSKAITLWALDDPAGGRWPDTGPIPAARTIRYTVNQIPKMTFDELQRQVSGGFHRLGVLRLDVDDLGQIFSSGLGNMASLSRLATLSMQVSLYFEGWVKQLSEHGPYRDLIYSVYAGGDDVFLIGPWELMPELARQITGEFSQYTGQNPALHASAGLAFIGGKYPIYQAAEDAFQALEAAKSEPGKNSFTFMGRSRSWPHFEQVVEKKSRLLRLVSKEEPDGEGLAGPQAILQVLQRLAAAEEERNKTTDVRPVWGPWMWQGAYLLSRMAERSRRGNVELAEALLSIRDELNEENYQHIDQWGFAARWAQLEIRSRVQEEGEK